MIMDHLGLIVAFIAFAFILYQDGFKGGIKLVSLYAIIGAILGLILDVKIFGDIGRYLLLLFLLIYGAFLYFKCGTDLSKSVEGQGICIKRAFSQLLSNIRK